MMYEPDKWVILRIKSERIITYKVLAGWYGGYLSGDAWKLNSGIVSYEETEEYYDFVGDSGSVYRCFKHAEGMSAYMGSILAGFQQKLGVTRIKPITIKTFKRNYGH